MLERVVKVRLLGAGVEVCEFIEHQQINAAGHRTVRDICLEISGVFSIDSSKIWFNLGVIIW